MLHVIKKLRVPRVILRYIMMNYLDLASIKTIILNIKEMNVLDDFSKTILSNAEYGLFWNCQNGHLSTVQYLISVGADIHAKIIVLSDRLQLMVIYQQCNIWYLLVLIYMQMIMLLSDGLPQMVIYQQCNIWYRLVLIYMQKIIMHSMWLP